MDLAAFDFEFGSDDRQRLLDRSATTLSGLNRDLGSDGGLTPEGGDERAQRLLADLNGEVCEFGGYPQVLALEQEHFIQHGLPVPVQFAERRRVSRFYWLSLPIVLKPPAHLSFNKLQCAIVFAPDNQDGHLLPRVVAILPDRKFQQMLDLNQSLEIRIGGSLGFEASVPGSLATTSGLAAAGPSVEAKLAVRQGMIAGPFRYTFKRALVDHTAPGSERVFWTITGTSLIQEDEPVFIVVVEVPNEVKTVAVTAVLQGYHALDIAKAGLTDVVKYGGQRIAQFFRQGAPARDMRMWQIPPRQ